MFPLEDIYIPSGVINCSNINNTPNALLFPQRNFLSEAIGF